jgi:hypothetical protein
MTFWIQKSPDMLQVEAENQMAAASTLQLHKRCALRTRMTETIMLKGFNITRAQTPASWSLSTNKHCQLPFTLSNILPTTVIQCRLQ